MRRSWISPLHPCHPVMRTLREATGQENSTSFCHVSAMLLDLETSGVFPICVTEMEEVNNLICLFIMNVELLICLACLVWFLDSCHFLFVCFFHIPAEFILIVTTYDCYNFVWCG